LARLFFSEWCGFAKRLRWELATLVGSGLLTITNELRAAGGEWLGAPSPEGVTAIVDESARADNAVPRERTNTADASRLSFIEWVTSMLLLFSDAIDLMIHEP